MRRSTPTRTEQDMDEIAKGLAEFRRSLRLEGFTASESMHLTGVYLTAMLTGALSQQVGSDPK